MSTNPSFENIKVLSKKEYRESRRLKPNDYISLKPAHQKSSHIALQTNAVISKIDLSDKSTPTVDKIQVATKPESEPKVSSGGLNLPPRDPDQSSTQLDMFKDEYSLEELLKFNITEIPFLLDKLIPKESLVVLAGQSEIGKSTLYTQLALAIIRGDVEFLGCKLNSTFNRVLIVSTEDGPIPLSFRANKQIIEATIGVEKYKNCNVIFNFDELRVRLKKYLDQNPVDLIIIDAFGDVFQGDINASNSVRNFLNTYVSFIQRYKCSVLFVHHICKGNKKQKSEKDQLLGSTGIEGKMRNVLMLSIVNDQHQLSIAKGNYVSREDKKTPLYLNFNSDALTFSRAEGPAKPPATAENDIPSSGCSSAEIKPGRKTDMALYNQTIQLFKEGKRQVEIAKIVGRDKSTISKWIKKYRSEQRPQYDTSLVGDVD